NNMRRSADMPLRVNRITGPISCVRESLLIDGQFMAISKYSRYPDWAMEFVRMACSKQAMVRSMEGGNAPPRGSSLRDPEMVAKLGWPSDRQAGAPRRGGRMAAQPSPRRHSQVGLPAQDGRNC